MERVIGIDLGTTNSCVAVVERGVPTVIPNRGGHRTTPSMVAVTESGKRVVGHVAKRQAITNAENTVQAVKRLIGRKWASSQVQSARQGAAYSVVQGPHGDARIKLRSETYSVPEISAMVLQEMRLFAEDYLGGSISKAVITVPAYFNDHQRQATKDAGQIAGLDVIRIINEPTAAALAYGFGKNLEKTIAIFDLGGGTFDISILELAKGGVFKVVATAGDTFLGGEDFDGRIIDWLVQGFAAEHGVDLRSDRMARQRLKDAAEKAKCELSSVTETDIQLPFIVSSDRNEALHLHCALSRDKLEELTEDLVDRCIAICRRTLEEARLKTSSIQEVVLVGGMTRMVRVQEAVRAFFGREPCQGVHPDEVVALGAAVQGAALVDSAHETLLLDVTPHPLGIMTFGANFEPLIPQNTTVPTARSKSFTTSRDNQTAVKILVMQGRDAEGSESDLLGEFILTGLRRAPKGQVEIEVTFEINADGIVSVRAKDLETDLQQSIDVTASSGLTKDEIDRMMDQACDYMVERRAGDELEAARQEAAKLLTEIANMTPAVEAAVGSSHFGREALANARVVLDRTRAAIARNEIAPLKEQMESLRRTHRMFKGALAP